MFKLNDKEFIICTNVYNRVHTLDTYLKSLKDTVSNEKFWIYFINNFDDIAKNNEDEIINYLKKYNIKNYSIITNPNVGLMGYNFGIEAGKIYDCPVMLCNDDIIFKTPKWNEILLNENIYEAKRHPDMKVHKIRPETIGAIGVTYTVCGSMRHQLYNSNNSGYSWPDFLVGHATWITKNALRKNFTFDTKICSIFGAFDIYVSMWMCANNLNSLVCHDICFDFPNSKENHFHLNNTEKFNHLKTSWDKMQKNLENYQKEHIKKYGYNKWFEE